MKLRVASPARADLRSIAAHIQTDNRSAARAVIQRIAARARELREFPDLGRPGRIAGTRELVVPRLPYVIVYRVARSMVIVLAVRHGARLWPVRL